jgi:S-adenosylmethionine-dependent methyltransferase
LIAEGIGDGRLIEDAGIVGERVEASRFDETIAEWRRYQTSVPGRVRTALLWRGLQPYLPATSARVLDLGGGGGEIAKSLALAGHAVTLVDYSAAMLALARENLAGCEVALVQGDVLDPALPIAPRFDVVCCHSVMEFVADPSGLMARCAGWLSPGGVLSVAFGNRRHAALRAAITDGDLARALHDLAEPTDAKDCFGLRKRLFDGDEVCALVAGHGFELVTQNGIRVVTDLLRPDVVADPARYDALLELETALLTAPAYRQMARYVQLIAVWTPPRSGPGRIP